MHSLQEIQLVSITNLITDEPQAAKKISGALFVPLSQPVARLAGVALAIDELIAYLLADLVEFLVAEPAHEVSHPVAFGELHAMMKP